MAASPPIRVVWGGPNNNLGEVRGPGGRVVWVRYHPREPRAPRVPRPLRRDEWPTSAAFAEMVTALSDGVRRPWRIKIVGARIRASPFARRCAHEDPSPLALVVRKVGAHMAHHFMTSPGRRAFLDPSPGIEMSQDHWRASAFWSRRWQGKRDIYAQHRRGGRLYLRTSYGFLGYGESAGAPQARTTRGVSGPHFPTAALAARLRAAAAAALGRRGEPAAFFAAVD